MPCSAVPCGNTPLPHSGPDWHVWAQSVGRSQPPGRGPSSSWRSGRPRETSSGRGSGSRTPSGCQTLLGPHLGLPGLSRRVAVLTPLLYCRVSLGTIASGEAWGLLAPPRPWDSSGLHSIALRGWPTLMTFIDPRSTGLWSTRRRRRRLLMRPSDASPRRGLDGLDLCFTQMGLT